MEDWDKQKSDKVEFHDITLSDISERDLLQIKSAAAKHYVQDHYSDNAKSVIVSYMDYLSSKGYRIIKK